MLTTGFLLKPLAVLLARAVLTKLLKTELTPSDVAEILGDGIGDLIAHLADDDFARKSADLFFLRIGRDAAQSLEEVFRLDGSTLAPELLEQTASALAATLQTQALPLLLQENLVKADFDRALRKVKPPNTLAAEAHDLFRSALQASSDRIFAIADTLPNFTRDTSAEILQRIAESDEIRKEILQKLAALAEAQRQSVEHNPANQQDRSFEQTYRNLLLRELDQMELFGISEIDSNYRPPISTAFINLRAVAAREEEREHLPQPRQEPVRLAVAQAVTQARRTLVVGGAGMGKTTLLRWLAVRLAAPGTDEQAAALAPWQDKLPIYLRLRDFPRGNLPAFEELPLAFPQFKELQGAKRPGWTSSLLAAGRVLLLFDGLDEISLRQCQVALNWLEKLLDLYADKLTCIVTTRYATLDKPDIARRFERAGFQRLDLTKMEPEDVERFVERWHTAMNDPRVGLPSAQLNKLPQLAASLRETLQAQPALRQLADTPLLCAMICAVNQRRNGNLPPNRLELYKLCSEMLLAARDEVRKVDRRDYIQLAPAQLQAQVAKLAYWMMRNGERVVKRRAAIHQLGLDLGKNAGERVLTLLLERCLLLREQSKNELEFVHGSFQEYLAAREILYRDDIGLVCKEYGTESDWRETILLVASQELGEEGQKTLLSKLNEATGDADKVRAVHVLALDAFSLMRQRYTPAVCDLAADHAQALVKTTQNEDGTTTQKLNLSGTQVSDVTALGKLTTLQTLYLSGTQVSDVTALGKLTNLQTLYLHNTAVSDVTALSKLTTLQALWLHDTQVSDVTALGKLTTLQTLWLHDTQVSDVTALGKLTTLQSLWLDNTAVSEVTALGKLTTLQALDLSQTAVSDVTALGKLTTLQALDLSQTAVSDVTALTGLANLQLLTLNRTLVEKVAPIAHLGSLWVLDLRNCPVADFSPLLQLPALKAIWVDDAAQLPAALRQRVAVNPSRSPHGEGPWVYWNWLRAEQQRQAQAGGDGP